MSEEVKVEFEIQKDKEKGKVEFKIGFVDEAKVEVIKREGEK